MDRAREYDRVTERKIKKSETTREREREYKNRNGEERGRVGEKSVIME